MDGRLERKLEQLLRGGRFPRPERHSQLRDLIVGDENHYAAVVHVTADLTWKLLKGLFQIKKRKTNPSMPFVFGV